jgi:hypothetical protein
VKDLLTRSTLFDLLRRNSKNREHLNHDLHSDIHHFGGQWHLGVRLETSEEVFDAPKYVDQSVLTSANIPSRLRDVHYDDGQWQQSK